MKRKYKIFILPLIAVMSLAIVACGKKKDEPAPVVASAPAVGTCQAGYVHHSAYGCLPQAHCQPGYGVYNNQCILASGGSTTPGGTYPGGTYPGGQYPGGNQGSCQGSCQAGYIQHQGWCLPQAHCGPCSGSYYGQCLPATQQYY